MKQILFSLLVLCFCSCSHVEDAFVISPQEELGLNVKSTLSQSDYQLVSEQLLSVVNTRATLNDEGSCHEALLPLIKDGELIQKQILEQLEDVDESFKDSLSFLVNLSEEDLASLSFVVYNSALLESENVSYTRGCMSVDRLRSCLGALIGLSVVREIGVGGVIKATTLRRALFAIGKRYLGYIGIALMVADFYDCYQG